MNGFNSVRSRSPIQASQPLEQPALLYGVLEGMMDGILVVTPQGEVMYANDCARQVCQQIADSPSNTVPSEIWRICTTLIESQQLFPEQNIILEDEIQTQQLHGLRIRARWIEGDAACLLVTLEDRDRNNASAALAEAQRYGLTERETEVWRLRRTNLSYKAIAAQLHIALDTVKKHLKNIRAKQQGALWDE